MAREVGSWSARKHHFLRRYMDMFATGMRRSWPGGVAYLELFAGPGVWYDTPAGRFEDGSPLLALEHPFATSVFIDSDPAATKALAHRLARTPRGDTAHVLHGDCNRLIGDAIALLPANGLVLAFVDPTNWRVAFDTIRRLATARKVDFILTFHDGNLKRVHHLDQQPRVDRFFGTTTWRTSSDGNRIQVRAVVDDQGTVAVDNIDDKVEVSRLFRSLASVFDLAGTSGYTPSITVAPKSSRAAEVEDGEVRSAGN